MTKICKCGHKKTEHIDGHIRYRDMIDKVVRTKCKHIRRNVKFHYKKSMVLDWFLIEALQKKT